MKYEKLGVQKLKFKLINNLENGHKKILLCFFFLTDDTPMSCNCQFKNKKVFS